MTTEIYVVPKPELDPNDPDDLNEIEVMEAVGPMLLNEDGSVMELVPACRKIVAEHQCANVQGMLVDAQSANVIVKVYDALNAENKVRLDELARKRGPSVVANICWKMVR